ncbi:Glu/Leu/Phe/Val dehydrogenase [Nocardioides sp. HDW12B]|uniref:Glu/Leu/Phe/Val family dehydrogenase n=1 Tax=Nocardioides sp. HDW12B TaxID=2714939 RepID=UPI001409C71C|nr:Glu/Leu/Phe/Val dehydrogenase [Nocardioides sp. HDW12B]QIK68178.1 Glu/Leu/Phe/Val dehydrogenase [Nocardioides sp. HDW12B]
MFDSLEGHEQVVFCSDPATGLRAIVAIHSTALGPSLGGTRFLPYADERSALLDVLHLSRGMTFKAAVAGLPLGGGKAVIIGDPATLKTPALLRAYGRFVEGLAGRYVTACDVGTFSADMDVVAETCRSVTGRSVERGGAGDSSVLTAFGVLQGMRAAAQTLWGAPTLTGRRVGVAGVGKVGRHLVDHLVEEGARVVVTDVDPGAVRAVTTAHGSVEVAADVTALLEADLDVYAPCALGGAVDADVAAHLRAQIVCGAANNQLAAPGLDEVLAARGVLYAPDYVVNAGGLVQVADELDGFDFARAEKRVRGIYDTTLQVLELSARDGITPAAAADVVALRRLGQSRELRSA